MGPRALKVCGKAEIMQSHQLYRTAGSLDVIHVSRSAYAVPTTSAREAHLAHFLDAICSPVTRLPDKRPGSEMSTFILFIFSFFLLRRAGGGDVVLLPQ